MNKFIRILILFVIISIIQCCRNNIEQSDIVSHLMVNCDNNLTIRCDYYESDNGALIIYLSGEYSNYQPSLYKGLTEILTNAKNKWNFEIIYFNFLPRLGEDKYITNEIIKLNKEVFTKDVIYIGRHVDGFALELKNRRNDSAFKYKYNEKTIDLESLKEYEIPTSYGQSSETILYYEALLTLSINFYTALEVVWLR